jgi:hypothetical protein
MTRAPLLLTALAVAPGAAAMPAPLEESLAPNAPALAADFKVVGKGSPLLRCSTERIREQLTWMLWAFNTGRGHAFASFFTGGQSAMHTYTTNGSASFRGRRSIAAHVFERWLLADGWTAYELHVPNGAGNVFELGLRLSSHGTITRDLGAKIVVNCDRGLIQHWVGPAFAP